MATNNYLEEEYAEPFNAWQTNQTPAGNAQILNTLQPVIDKGVRTHVGEPNPLLLSRARQLTLQGLRSYDPNRARLQTHLFNQYKGLKRIASQQTQGVHIPERVVLDRYNLERHTQDMTDELGREPTDRELSDRTGFSLRRLAHVRKAQGSVAEGTLEAAAPGLLPAMHPHSEAQSMWVQMVYDDLPPIDQKILEHTLGLHGRPPLSNQEIAAKLGRSPGAISQRKKRIQALLDQEADISPFLS